MYVFAHLKLVAAAGALATTVAFPALIDGPAALALSAADDWSTAVPVCVEEDCSDVPGAAPGQWLDPDTGTWWLIYPDPADDVPGATDTGSGGAPADRDGLVLR